MDYEECMQCLVDALEQCASTLEEAMKELEDLAIEEEILREQTHFPYVPETNVRRINRKPRIAFPVWSMRFYTAATGV